MYICVDFDGTVVDHRYPDIGEPVPVAIDLAAKAAAAWGKDHFVHHALQQIGRYESICRDAVQFMESNGIKLFGVNRNPDQDTWTSSPKAYGEVYVDDSAFGCPLIHPKGFARPCVDWKKVGPQLEHMLLSRR